MIAVGDVYKRRVEFHDAYDVVRVCAIIDNNGERPDEYSLQSVLEFGPTIVSVASGITDHCDLVSSGDPEQAAWESSVSGAKP